MSQTQTLNVLVTIALEDTARYRTGLKKEPQFKVTMVNELEKGREVLDDPAQQIDVVVVDSKLGDVYDHIKDIRNSYPRLIILLVDEDADFAMPGRADDVTTAPFEDDDLINRIKRLNEDRRLQTLRADALPPVRSFAKSILKAGKGKAKQQAAVEAVRELGYDYVAFYTISQSEPPELTLIAQDGGPEATQQAPKKIPYENNLAAWVAQNGQSRVVASNDDLSHPLLDMFKSGACVPVGTTMRFGVMVAFKSLEGAISEENVMMLELVSAQLASALAKDAR